MARQNLRDVAGAPPPLLARLWPTLRGTILPAYEARGDVAFAYVQGSIVAAAATFLISAAALSLVRAPALVRPSTDAEP